MRPDDILGDAAASRLEADGVIIIGYGEAGNVGENTRCGARRIHSPPVRQIAARIPKRESSSFVVLGDHVVDGGYGQGNGALSGRNR